MKNEDSTLISFILLVSHEKNKQTNRNQQTVTPKLKTSTARMQQAQLIDYDVLRQQVSDNTVHKGLHGQDTEGVLNEKR